MRYPNTWLSTRNTETRIHVAGRLTSFSISAAVLPRIAITVLAGQLQEHVLERALDLAQLAHRDVRQHQLPVDPGDVRGLGLELERAVVDPHARRAEQPFRPLPSDSKRLRPDLDGSPSAQLVDRPLRD